MNLKRFARILIATFTLQFLILPQHFVEHSARDYTVSSESSTLIQSEPISIISSDDSCGLCDEWTKAHQTIQSLDFEFQTLTLVQLKPTLPTYSNFSLVKLNPLARGPPAV